MKKKNTVKQKTIKNRVEQEQNYIKFLEKRLASENFINNCPDDIEITKKKLSKARLILKLLENK